MELTDIIVAPILSEKSHIGSSSGIYIFKVHHGATKTEIKQAVEKFFKVDVTEVNTAKFKGKIKGRYYFRKGRRPKWKKAYVTLKKGQNIPDLFTDMGT
jgi:large subunit ribosomal protein L23